MSFSFEGGCGAMYEIHIESEEFKEKRTVLQHQMVNQVSSVVGAGRVCYNNWCINSPFWRGRTFLQKLNMW